MGPVDRRLLTRFTPVRSWVLLSGLLTATGSAATIGMGIIIGTTVADALSTPIGWSQLRGPVAALVALAAVRVAVAWALARFGQAAAAEVIAQLRTDALRTLAVSDPRSVDTAYWRTMLTVGVDGLGAYISGFLPALVATMISTPLALAALAWLDIPSLVIAVITLPLIPLFMWLVGKLTQGRTEAKLRDISIVRGQIFDLIQGLPTLVAHGMTKAPEKEIERLSTAHQKSSMAVLRIAFLSGMVLEFLATLSVALVAVGIGFRLLDGNMTLAAGLAVLIIIPEVYGPVRAVGSRFHDAQDGLVASHAILDLLDTPAASTEVYTQAEVSSASNIVVTATSFSAVGRDGYCPRDLSFTAAPGEIVVLAGANGVGKSTALLAIAGIITDELLGTIEVAADEVVLTPEERMQLCAWVPQRPVLDPTRVGDSSGLSLGQRHRTALRTELADTSRPLVLFDEPTAHLDEASAIEVLRAVRHRAHAGATVIIASHDPLAFAEADRVVEVHK